VSACWRWHPAELPVPFAAARRRPAGGFFVLLEAAVGVWLITGVRLREAALVVSARPRAAARCRAGGHAGERRARRRRRVLVLVRHRTPARRGGREPGSLARALLLLRLGAAVSLVGLAFSEKFTNPDMARAMLVDYPQLNIFATLGIPVSTDAFIVLAGGVEVLFGLLILSGAAPQVVVPVAFVPFNLTLLLFGSTELIGHLPVYGVLLALLVYGSSAATAGLVRAFDVRPGRSLGDERPTREAGRVNVV
jgi:hypothetical protein